MTGCDLPTIDEIYVSRLQKKGLTILKDRLHPDRHLFTPLPYSNSNQVYTFSEQYLLYFFMLLITQVSMHLHFTPYNW